jgi:two-component system response regulator CpxR
MYRLLMIDDDIELCRLLKEYLNHQGFQLDLAHAGHTGLAKARRDSYDLIILDVMLPQLSGFDLLRQLRTAITTPVLMLTARDDEVDSVVGLEIGADDYLAKPCNPRVLLARIRALLRRAEPTYQSRNLSSATLSIDDIRLELSSRSLYLQNKLIELTATEFDILAILLKLAGQVVSKQHLYQQGLKRSYSPYDRSLDMHLSNLRKKLGPLANGTARIQTLRNQGYLYVCQPDNKTRE